MTAYHSCQSPPSATAPAGFQRHQADSQATRDADEAYTRSISRCEALVARIDLDIAQVHQRLDRIRPAAEANIVQATHLSTEHRKHLAAMQWQILVAKDLLEDTNKQLVQIKTTILDVVARANSIVEELRSGGSVTQAVVDEFVDLTRALSR